MTIKLSNGLRANSANADPVDVRQVKQTLNQFGYYMPDAKIGMRDVYKALLALVGMYLLIYGKEKRVRIRVPGHENV